MMQLHKDVPKAANFYSQGLGFTVNVCTPRWAELHSDSFKLALLHSSRYPFTMLSFLNSISVYHLNPEIFELLICFPSIML